MADVFYEFKDTDGKWYLGCMPAEMAFICQIRMGENFHYVDESAIIFEEEEV